MSMQSSDATESVAAVSASGTPVTTTPELSAQGRDLLLGALESTSLSTAAADAEPSAMESGSAANGAAAAADTTVSPLLPPPSTTASFAAPDTLATSSGRSSSFNNRTSNVENVEDFLFDSTASTPGVAHEVHWEGYVRKKGDWLPRWEERYLVLDGAALTYYNTKEEARSARNLRGRMIISKVRPENYGKAHGFLIETKGHKHFHLCCSTELEKDMWVEMMQAAIDEGVKHSVNGNSMDSDVVPVQNSPTQVDLRSFYYAFRQLLISHSSSPQFFPKLSRDVVLTSNYAPTVPFWGEYHGLDGVLHFFSILYETVEFTAFFVTDIAQAKEGSTAVVAGRETMKNRDNGRKFTQQWQHTIEFAPDGRVKSLTIHADPVAASAVFGCNATSSLSLPMAAVVGNSSQDNPAGTLHVVVFRGEQILNHVVPGDDSDADSSSGEMPLPQRRVFLGLRLITDGKTNVYAPSSSSSCLARTRICEADEAVDPKWNSQHELSFKGSSRGKPCFMLIEAWEVKEKEHEDDPDVEEIIVHLGQCEKAFFIPISLASLERTCPTPFDFDFENTELTKQKLQELIFEDVCAFHPDARIPEASPNGSISCFGSNSRSASSSNVRAQPTSSVPRADVTPPVPSSVPMAEPASNVYGSHDSQTNGKPPRPAPVVLLPPATLAATATTTATHERSMAETEIVREEVAIDIRDSNAEVHFISAESNAAEEESFDDIGSTSIHNVVLTETSTENSSTERAIDLSASPHKLSLPKNLLTPSSVV
uniref:PH domain-containing protein n=1 Tax=Globisporangium ultimum (strain ATCC 200006 / CBS 805.95 / DAOM BR144) TaxID=431595 RepID=K3WV69_GLOUD